MTLPTAPIRGACHCGAVRWELDDVPAHATECNCSACRRFAALWVSAPASRIALDYAHEATIGYVWGDATLAFHTCRTCGCTTHWESLMDADDPPMAVNLRMADADVVAAIPVRHFDGADSFRFLD